MIILALIITVIILSAALLAAILKIITLRVSISHIADMIEKIVNTDTNAQISTFSCDPIIKKTASLLNRELACLRKLEIKYREGDGKLKDAITNISHDLRTPLTVINGYIEQLSKEIKNEKALRQLQTVKNRVHELIALTDELFRYTVTLDTEFTPISEKTLINEMLEKSMLDFYTAFTERGIKPQSNICDKRIYRYTDRNALSRIFSNIISNAIKYAENDFLVSLTEDGVITFSNTASELNYIDVEHLLDRYYTVKSESKSTGLGLSIARLLAERLGYEISAFYEEGILKISVKI